MRSNSPPLEGWILSKKEDGVVKKTQTKTQTDERNINPN